MLSTKVAIGKLDRLLTAAETSDVPVAVGLLQMVRQVQRVLHAVRIGEDLIAGDPHLVGAIHTGSLNWTATVRMVDMLSAVMVAKSLAWVV